MENILQLSIEGNITVRAVKQMRDMRLSVHGVSIVSPAIFFMIFWHTEV